MISNLQIQKSTFGCKQILLKKLSFAVTSSVFSQVIILLFYLSVVNFNLLHPLECITVPFKTVTTFSTWLYMIPFAAIVFAQSIICAKDYILTTKYCSTRFQKFISVFSVHNLILLTLHIVIGGICVWLFLSLSNSEYSVLFKKCGDNNCFVEKSFYLVLCGLWTGFYFFVSSYTSEKKILFPVIQQRKLLQFKAKLGPLINESYKSAFWPTVYFIIIYYVWGNYFSSMFTSIFYLNGSSKDDSTIYIYLYAWFMASLIYFYMKLMIFYYELFLTEDIVFPLVSVTKDCLTLTDGINSDIPIIQHLACLDLFTFAGQDRFRREVLFTLSQPGGHPHNWNNLTQILLKIITDYTKTLNNSTNSILMPEKSKIASTIDPLSPITKHINYDNTLRNMSFNNSCFETIQIKSQNEFSFLSTEQSENIRLALVEKFNNLISNVKRKLGIDFIFGELPEANIQKCLGDGQVILWISQGLSSLTVASLQEDRYGIVQKDLPVIISTLVNLKLSLEKLNRIPALNRRSQGFEDFNSKMKTCILSAVKRSLYHICHNFGPYLKDLNLKKDVMLQLVCFFNGNENF